jgi:hypothetical protein
MPILIGMHEFSLHCYKNLKAQLGIFDAAIQFNELSRRHLAEIANQNDKPWELIKALGKEHNIHTDTTSILNSESRMSQLYTLSIYQVLDTFLHNYIDEVAEIFGFDNDWKNKTDSGDYLEFCLRKLETISPSCRAKIGDFRIEILHYYRTVRNCFMHNLEGHEKADKKQLEIIAYKSAIIENYKTSAPNQYDKIDIHDFFLYTRVAKNVARDMGNLARPPADVLINYTLKKTPRLKGKKDARDLDRALKSILLARFGIEDEAYFYDFKQNFLKSVY